VPRRIGLVLLDYDQSSVTRRCLRSVATGKRRPDEIVLVENGERRVDLDSDEALAELGVHVLRPGRNIGAAAGRNLGLDYLVENTDVECFVLLDNDATVSPDFFELVATMPLEPFEIAAPLVFGTESEELIYAGGSFDRHLHPSIITEWPEDSTERRLVDWAPTVAIVFDRDLWLRVGGFDPWYEFLWEDIDWCYRATGLGATIRAVPQLRVMHDPHQSTGGVYSPQRVRLWSRNSTVFMFSIAEVGWHSRLRWLVLELRRVVRELRAGRRWRRSAMRRLRGLGEGLREAMRRRLQRARP
jgi:GT2 family glycosyltransferase